MAGRISRALIVILGLTVTSCTALPVGSPVATTRGPIANPIFVAANSADPQVQLFLSERAADLLHRYNFELESANQLEGTIATRYKVGSGIAEPWHKESVGMANRLESTFQSIRRKVLVHFTQVEGGYLVGVEALKELEDPTSPSGNSAGASSFVENSPLRRDLNAIVGQASPSGWIPLGRDVALEQEMLCKLESAYRR